MEKATGRKVREAAWQPGDLAEIFRASAWVVVMVGEDAAAVSRDDVMGEQTVVSIAKAEAGGGS